MALLRRDAVCVETVRHKERPTENTQDTQGHPAVVFSYNNNNNNSKSRLVSGTLTTGGLCLGPPFARSSHIANGERRAAREPGPPFDGCHASEASEAPASKRKRAPGEVPAGKQTQQSHPLSLCRGHTGLLTWKDGWRWRRPRRWWWWRQSTSTLSHPSKNPVFYQG